MNSKKYNINRFLNILKGIIPSVFSFFCFRKNDQFVFNSEFNKKFNHNSKFLFEYFISNYPKLKIKFVINDKSLRNELCAMYGDHFITSTKIADIIFIITSRTWITSSLETPIGGLFLNFNRNVIHLGHGAPIKRIGLNENYKSKIKYIYYKIVRTNFSYFLSTSEVFDENWSRCLGISKDKVFRAPQSRNISLISGIRPKSIINNSSKNVLYAPTWRPFSNTKIFPFNDFDLLLLEDFLDVNDMVIYLRIHPNFESEIDRSILSNRIKILGRKEIEDINDVLMCFDILITDYSSIYVDFLLTNKPIIFLPYDISLYEEVIGLAIDYYKYTPGPKPKNFSDFIHDLKSEIDGTSRYLSDRIEANKILNVICNDPCKQNARLILSLIDV